MRFATTLAAVFSLFLAQLLFLAGGFRSAAKADLQSAFGGVCEICVDQPDPCKDSVIGFACKPNPLAAGTFIKATGTNIIQKFCADVLPGEKGKTKCESIDLKDCVYDWTCSDKDCKNCGDKATERKTTDCDQAGGKACP